MSTRRPCSRCGIDVTTGGNTGAVVCCRDCRAADPWYVEHVEGAAA